MSVRPPSLEAPTWLGWPHIKVPLTIHFSSVSAGQLGGGTNGHSAPSPAGHLMGIALLLHKQTTKCLLMAQTHRAINIIAASRAKPNQMQLNWFRCRHCSAPPTKCNSVTANVVTAPGRAPADNFKCRPAKEQQHAQLEWFSGGSLALDSILPCARIGKPQL